MHPLFHMQYNFEINSWLNSQDIDPMKVKLVEFQYIQLHLISNDYRQNDIKAFEYTLTSISNLFLSCSPISKPKLCKKLLFSQNFNTFHRFMNHTDAQGLGLRYWYIMIQKQFSKTRFSDLMSYFLQVINFFFVLHMAIKTDSNIKFMKRSVHGSKWHELLLQSMINVKQLVRIIKIKYRSTDCKICNWK